MDESPCPRRCGAAHAPVVVGGAEDRDCFVRAMRIAGAEESARVQARLVWLMTRWPAFPEQTVGPVA